MGIFCLIYHVRVWKLLHLFHENGPSAPPPPPGQQCPPVDLTSPREERKGGGGGEEGREAAANCGSGGTPRLISLVAGGGVAHMSSQPACNTR